jgi:hypothetical protein
MIKGWPLRTTLRPLTATAGRACHLGFLSMKLILTVRSVWMVTALNWATALLAVTAAKPTASASANLIKP